MKYKLIILFIFITFKAFADECKNFEDKVMAIPFPENGIVSDGQQPRYDTGIYFLNNFNYKKNKVIIERNKNNFPILRISFFNDDIKSEQPIQKINDKDLSKLSDNDIRDLLKEKNLKITQNDKTYNLKANNYDFYPFDLNYFLLNSIENIDTKSGEFSIDYAFKVSHERPDWIEAGREIGNLTICNINKLTESSKIYSPVTNETIFIENIKYDVDKNFSAFEQVYYKDTDKTFTDAIFSGLHIIKAKFDFEKFPFDVQNLKIELEHAINIESNKSGHYPKPYLGLFDIKPSVYNNINEYKENNLLKEWKIINFNVKNKIDIEKAQDPFDPHEMKVYETDSVVIEIFIKRKSEYYLFKIIIPVFIILSIAWAVLWIPPNQVESRLTTSIVALLALIAYNFVSIEDIPKLSYLTSMDRYILLSYLYCCIPIYLTIYFSRINNKNYNRAVKINKKSRLYGSISYLFLVTLSFSDI